MIRMNTDYSDNKSHNNSKGTAKTKLEQFRNQNRFTDRHIKGK
jgi:hypothetical protein